MNATYYALIRRHDDGRLSAWIPDIPDVMASGLSEEEVIQELSRGARRHLQETDERGCLGRRREGSMN
jgi:predicted RNase H-like HicB family nuclease